MDCMDGRVDGHNIYTLQAVFIPVKRRDYPFNILKVITIAIRRSITKISCSPSVVEHYIVEIVLLLCEIKSCPVGVCTLYCVANIYIVGLCMSFFMLFYFCLSAYFLCHCMRVIWPKKVPTVTLWLYTTIITTCHILYFPFWTPLRSFCF